MCLSRPYPFKFFKACLPQVLLGPLLNTLSQMCLCFALTHLHEYFVQQDCLVMSSICDFHIFKESIVNDRLIYLDTYFTSKALGRTLLRITWALIKKNSKKSKNNKKCQACQGFTNHNTFSKFLPKLITKIFLFLLFKLASCLNLGFKQPWALIKNTSRLVVLSNWALN